MRFLFYISSSVLALRSSGAACAALAGWGVGRERIAAGLILCAVSGCATEDIVVSEVALTDRPDASVVGWTANERGREVFSPEDEEVTIKVLFNFNYRGVYEWFKVEWIAPGGVDYQAVLRRTEFASHRDFKASLKIRGKMASRLPGLWRVRVSLRGRDGAPDRELVSRMFRIAEPTAKMIAAGLTPVDMPKSEVMPSSVESGVAAVSLHSTAADPGKPLILRRDRRLFGCPPLYYPPGPGCVEQAPEE